MIVVSDTSPICYLLLINQIAVLSTLYQTVIIPQGVANELSASASPAIVKSWIAQPPGWLEVRQTKSAQALQPYNLDLGEREAIAIAEQLNADLIILDDKAARQFASSRGLKVIGLLGVLKVAARQDLLDLKTTFEQLRNAGFWISPQLLAQLLESP